MSVSRVDRRLKGSVVVKAAFVAVSCIGAFGTAMAGDHKVQSQLANFDCSAVKPGDTITIASGTRGPLTIRDCKGSSASPIIIRNDPSGSSPTVIRRAEGSAGGFIFSCNTCIDVEIDGSYKWKGAPSGKTYGMKITMTGGAEPTAFLRVAGLSRFVTIRNIEVAGVFPQRTSIGIGISVNDHSVNRSQYPTLWREGILIEDNYVHNVSVAGMYVGPNYAEKDLPLRNIEIRGNRIEDTGWEAINTKSMWEGDNSIHHNVIRRAGLNGDSKGDPSQYSGITNNSGKVEIYNNWIEKTGQHGIQVWTVAGPKESEGRGPFTAHIWNNVILDAGGLWRPFMLNSYGINVGAQDGCEKPIPYVYNNTIVDSRQTAINLGSNVGSGGYVRDNLIAGLESNAIRPSGSTKLINNLVGSVAQMDFVDPGRLNFRLTKNSPARNQGSNAFPQIDFDNVTRPKEGTADQGAFEANF